MCELSQLHADLKHWDDQRRWSAAKAISKQCDPISIPFLCDALSDSDILVCVEAVKGLSYFGDARALPGLVPHTKSEERILRCAAFRAIGEIGCRDPDPEVVPILCAELDDPNAEFRELAASFLERIPDVRATASLKSALNDANAKIRLSSIRALAQIGSTALPVVKSALAARDSEVRDVAVDTLIEISPREALPFLLKELGSHSPKRQSAAAERVGTMGHLAAEILPSAAKLPDAGVRRWAVGVLGKFEDPAYIPVFEAALEDEDSTVRICALRALGTVGPAATAVLCRLLEHEHETLAREARGILIAHAAVSEICTAIPALTRAAREMAISVLTEIGTEAAIPTLVQQLVSPHEEVVISAALALKAIAEREPSLALRTALPGLQRRANLLSSVSREAKAHLRSASQTIEHATGARRQHPLPSTPPQRNTVDLPLVGDVPEPNFEELPRPIE